MLVDEAAEHLVTDYRAITQGKLRHFDQLVGMLCYLYPAVSVNMANQEVARNFADSAHRKIT